MRPELEALKKDTESLPDGPDKQDALRALAELQRSEQEFEKYQQLVRAEEERVRRRRIVLRLVALPAGLFLGWLAILLALGPRRHDLSETPFVVAMFGIPAVLLLLYALGLLPRLPAVPSVSRAAIRRTYEPPSRSKLALMGIVAVVVALFLSFVKIPGALESGRYQTSRDNVYTASADPIMFWTNVTFLAVCAAACVVGFVFCVAALVRYPHHPFGDAGTAPATADELAEAEVYVAFGRVADAIKILEEARVAHPERMDIATKLIELRGLRGIGSRY